jgi:hypothetical protein
MIPRLLEWEEDRVKVTPEAYSIPEVNQLIKKYESDVEPYLAYVSALSYPDSPYKNIPKDERAEAAIFDIKETLGEFDEEDELILPAVERLRALWESPQTLMADEMEEELHRWRKYLKDTPLIAGQEGNMKDRLSFIDKVEKISMAAANIRKIADDEIGPKMKGSNVIGEY